MTLMAHGQLMDTKYILVYDGDYTMLDPYLARCKAVSQAAKHNRFLLLLPLISCKSLAPLVFLTLSYILGNIKRFL